MRVELPLNAPLAQGYVLHALERNDYGILIEPALPFWFVFDIDTYRVLRPAFAGCSLSQVLPRLSETQIRDLAWQYSLFSESVARSHATSGPSYAPSIHFYATTRLFPT